MNSGTTIATTPVEHALGTVEVAVTELITVLRDGGLDHHGQAGLLELLDRAEVVRNQWQAVDAELLAVCRDRGIAERECQQSMAKVLERRCLINPGEARRRMKAADAVGPRETSTGMPLPRLRDAIGAAMVGGAVTSQQVAMVDDVLGQLDQAGVHADQVAQVETELIGHCQRYGPKELKQLCQKYLDTYDPDGPEPNEQRNEDRRSWRMHTTPSGAMVGEFRLTPEAGAKAHAIFSSLTDLRADKVAGKATTDLRSHEQRMHDAFDDMCSRILRAGGLPDSGGTPATVIVTIDQADLLNDLAERGLYHPATGTTVPFGTCPTCGHHPASPDEPAAQPGAMGPTEGEQRRVGRSLSPSKGRPPPTGPSTSSGNETAHPDCPSASSGNETPQSDRPSTSSSGEENVPPRQPVDRHPATGVVDGQDLPTGPAGKPSHGQPSASIHPAGPPGRVRRRPRHGITSDGTLLTVPELLKLAGEAEIYPVVLTTHGKLLDLGRTRRIANKHQTLALIARDGGCSFPGCNHPPEWCERHHVISWRDNGYTNLRNLTLLCSYHHRHFLDRGWLVRINQDGLPEWIPPRYVDPDQKPMINNRIIARIHQAPLLT